MRYRALTVLVLLLALLIIPADQDPKQQTIIPVGKDFEMLVEHPVDHPPVLEQYAFFCPRIVVGGTRYACR